MELRTLILCCCCWLIVDLINDQVSCMEVLNVAEAKKEKPYTDQITEIQNKIMANYSRQIRPSKSGNATELQMGAYIENILEVNEVEQTVSVRYFMFWDWVDEYLSWNPDDYNGTTKIPLFYVGIWRPDIVLYNNAAGSDAVDDVKWEGHLWVTRSGRVTAMPTYTVRVTCIFDFTDYPNDVQRCPLIMGSWSYTMKELIVDDKYLFGMMMGATDDKLVAPGGWLLSRVQANLSYWQAAVKARTDVKPEPSQYAATFTEINIWLILNRHSPYFGMFCRAPAVMCSFLCLLSFWTFSNTHGIAILLTSVLIQAVFMEDLLQRVPPSTGSVPRIVRYYAFNLSATVVAALILMVMESLTNLDKSGRPLPPFFELLVRSGDRQYHNILTRLGIRKAPQTTDSPSDIAASNDKETRQSSGNDANWARLCNWLKCFCFTIYSLLYFIYMCVML